MSGQRRGLHCPAEPALHPSVARDKPYEREQSFLALSIALRPMVKPLPAAEEFIAGANQVPREAAQAVRAEAAPAAA